MVDEGNVAENIRRIAGLHDVSLGAVGAEIGLSRAGINKLVAADASKRSHPKTTNAIKLADLFGITLNDLYSDPPVAVQAAVSAWAENRAPIAQPKKKARK